jgi:regulator of protease activity HflC (stomatin/prohibitin superfamily)
LERAVIVEVPKGYLAAKFQGSEIREVLTEPGVYFKSPFASFKTQQKLLGYEVTLPGFTSDGAKVPVLVRASAVVSSENLREIFRINPEGTALAPTVEQALREAVARSVPRYSEQEIDENRRKLESAVRDAASNDLKGHFVELKEMQLAVFSPEDSVH